MSELIDQKEWMNPNNLNLNNKNDAIRYLTHKKAYEEIYTKIKGLNILEIGCGAGYGSKYLSSNAKTITTVDLDHKSLDFAKANNFADNITYINANVLQGLPFEENRFDFVNIFQVIEHIDIDKTQSFLHEIKRVMKPGAYLFMTTPNRKTRLQTYQKPTNKYHTQEFSEKTLKKLIVSVFSSSSIKGLTTSKKEIINELIKWKQTPFQAYFRNPLRRFILKTAIIFKINPLIKFLNDRTVNAIVIKKDSDVQFDFQITDFYFEGTGMDKSIDLLAECIK